ncbi:MAG: hypothetical protein D6752_06495 [Candidatus Nitrosothermus koennekii]|nr:MAG: hypothetical protein D6752_06495 [Candidatus Nitrosothermus koennekii]
MLSIPPSLCLECRGSKLLCGLAYCPIMVRFNLPNIVIDKDIEGSTPPSVFVGRIGYPKVSIGPLLPPVNEDTSIYDKPEEWSNLRLDEILRFRLSLVRGSMLYNIDKARDPDNKLLKLQELAIAKEPVNADMRLEKIRNKPYINEHIPPFGPSGKLLSFNASNPNVDKRIEKAWYDKDLKASNAIIKLYDQKVPLSNIIKAFSIGMLGSKRRLVPTRWSITAIDDTISKMLVKRVKEHATINEYHVYVRKASMNVFVAILMPNRWQFEWIEAWFPNTTWNMQTYGEPEILGDYEGYKGIDHYANVGGCYYSARLATAEHLNNIRREASILILREIYPGFNLPIGVWFVREQLRAMFNSKPMIFNNLDDAINYAMSNLKIPLSKWREKSRILQSFKQKRLIDYL